MNIRLYRPESDAQQALGLWERALGATYPVSRRVFLSRIGDGAPSWNPGDTVVAEAHGALAGLASLELHRQATGHGEDAYVSAIMVDPGAVRRGIGSALLRQLEERARAEGCKTLRAGQSALRFFTGVPEDLPAAISFFRKQGYVSSHRAPDMIVDCRKEAMVPRYQEKLAAAGARVESCTVKTLPALTQFEAGAWLGTMMRMVGLGDMDNVLGVFHGDEVIGSILTYTPQSRFRSACLIWERLCGERMGGYGEVFIAPAWRGRGLGAAMSEAAALHVQSRGADCCFIGWVGPHEFYRKIGARIWRWHEMFAKPL